MADTDIDFDLLVEAGGPVISFNSLLKNLARAKE